MSIKKKRRGINSIALVFFVLIATVYLYNEKFFATGKDAKGHYLHVIKIFDGDTVSVLVDGKQEKVRLIGIDAPEMGQKPWGENAKSYLETLLSSSAGKIKLEYDIETRDQYGRLLAYMWTQDNRHVNLLMLENGYAMLYTFPPNVKHVEEFRAAQTKAREKEIGIWGSRGLKERPGDYRKEHPRF
jgi:micrococcal nuclease